MNQMERDDFSHALGQTLQFFGKKLEKSDFSFWYSAMGDKPVIQIKNALKEYVKVGKFAPRPANILELLNQNSAHQRAALPPPEKVETSCPPEIADAWCWFIRKIGGEMAQGMLPEVEGVTPDMEERFLHIVNHEAKRTNQPESIPDAFKLAEVWG